MRVREPRWARFARAAVGDVTETPQRSRREELFRQISAFRRRIAAEQAAQSEEAGNRRPDIRLLPAVVGAWGSAAVAIVLPGELVAGAALILAVALLAVALLAVALPAGWTGGRRFRWRPWRGLRRRSRTEAAEFSLARTAARTTARPTARPLAAWPRTGVPAGSRHPAVGLGGAAAPTVVLATICVIAVLSSVALKSLGSAATTLEQAAAGGKALVVTLEVGATPRLLSAGNGPPRVAFEATVLRAAGAGREVTGRMPVRVVAGPSWGGVKAGDTATTAGTISPPHPGESVAGILRPTTRPQAVAPSRGGIDTAVVAVRSSWLTAVHMVWEGKDADTAGLLPGMVMGERGGMDPGLEAAMKTVGLTHLTAVSGANCTLVLAFLMVGLRSLRTPRRAAVAASGAGLVAFVMVVGPDPSVLRAAVMGVIGAMAMLGGRPKHVGALLSVSILVLLVADPWLAADFAFILSVLATLGLHLAGQRCVRWLAAVLPLWLAQGIAIPLAAQLFCAPVIVLLQARLTPYTIPANMLVAPVVALVTTIGTLGMAVAAVLPTLAALCAAVSGAGAWWVAFVARHMSALPAASLPWPSGLQGVILMSLLNAAVLAALFAVVERHRAQAAARRVAALLPERVRRHGFPAAAAFAAAAAAWWTAAVLRL